MQYYKWRRMLNRKSIISLTAILATSTSFAHQPAIGQGRGTVKGFIVDVQRTAFGTTSDHEGGFSFSLISLTLAGLACFINEHNVIV